MAEVRRLEAELDNLDDMYKTNLAHSMNESSKEPLPRALNGWGMKQTKGRTCSEILTDKCGTNCADLKFAGWLGCSGIPSPGCESWYEWGMRSWKICKDNGNGKCMGLGFTCGHT